MVYILGLDPGLRHTGWGVISIQGNRLSHVAHGVIDAEQEGELAYRLQDLFYKVTQVIESSNDCQICNFLLIIPKIYKLSDSENCVIRGSMVPIDKRSNTDT